jgi:diguanylate cyclase (GGDEF)-like protein
MGRRLAHEHLLAIIETQNEIAASALDLDAVLRLVVCRAQELTAADGAVLELPEAQEMVYRAVNGSAEPLLGIRVPVEGSFSGRCLRTGEILNCRDGTSDDRVDAEACRRMGAVSLLCVPLQHATRIIGVLTVYAATPAAFHYAEERTLDLLGGVAAAHLTHSRNQDRVRRENLYDALTGLQNRRAFDQRLGGEVARIRRHGGTLALCLLDLDDFREINDTLGHPVGDEILRGIARRLERVRGEDTAFRVGGDRFAIMFSEIGAAGARVAAQRLEAAILSDPDCGGVEASWGVSDLESGDPAQLLAAAEAELRDDKRARRQARDSF